MGYSYDLDGNLACDACESTGTTRKRHCPHKVYYRDHGSNRGLPYCPAPALCADCYQKHKPTLHTPCKAGAAKRQAELDNRRVKLDQGGAIVTSAWGDWHATVKPGMVGVLFRSKHGIEIWKLVPEADYKPMHREFLDDYTTTEPWTPHA